VILDGVRVTARTVRTAQGTTQTIYEVRGHTYRSRERLLEEHGRSDKQPHTGKVKANAGR